MNSSCMKKTRRSLQGLEILVSLKKKKKTNNMTNLSNAFDAKMPLHICNPHVVFVAVLSFSLSYSPSHHQLS